MHTMVMQQCISRAQGILFCLLYLTFRHNTVHPCLLSSPRSPVQVDKLQELPLEFSFLLDL